MKTWARQNIRLTVAYDGGYFCGWQRSENANKPSVQGTLEQALTSCFKVPVKLSGSGRTDAGVHAWGQTANGFVPKALWEEKTESGWRTVWNDLLPEGVRVREVSEAPDGFHSRYDAKGKTYFYLFDTGEVPSVFRRRYVYPCGGRPDTKAMRQAARSFLGEHDFSAFSSRMEEGRGTVRRIDRLDFTEQQGLLRMEVSGDGFLYHMVRILAGTLYEVGIGERNPDSIAVALQSGIRQDAGRMLPGSGLVLMRVRYGAEEL